MFFDRPASGELAILVHLNLDSEAEREDPREFEELVLSAGGDPAAFIMGSRKTPHPRTFVGSGKLQEIIDEVALQEALRIKGVPIVFTSILLVGVFGLFALTSFPPAAHFGLLSALAFALTLLAVLGVLPSLLLKVPRKRSTGKTQARHLA